MKKINNKNKSVTEDPETYWTIIKSYFTNKHLQQLVRHQIESYNDFITRQIPNTIEMFNPVHICSEHDYDKTLQKYSLEIFINFENFGIYRPQIHENNGATKLMFPQEARLRNFTYSSNMTVSMNIKYLIRNGENLENVQTIYKVLPNIHIGKIPIMLRSNVCVLTHYTHMPSEMTGECRMDPGGYFIINGSEKTVLGQERAAENIIYCFNISKGNTKWSYMAEIKCVPDWKCISPKQISMLLSLKNNGYGNSIWIQIPRLKQPIPLIILFRALGIISDKEICEIVVLDIKNPQNKLFINCLRASIVEANNCLTKEDAIKYLVANVIYTPLNIDKEAGLVKKHEFALDVLNNDLFPHCHNKIQKIYFLGYMTLQLLKCSNNIIPTSDRDSYINKRIDLTGILLNNLFRNYFNKLVKDMQKQVIREINNGSWKSCDDYINIINLTNIYKIVKSTTIENGFKRALATGDFGIKQTNNNKVGVAQVLNRLTYISGLSHLRRCNTPIDKSGKLIPPRKLHNSTWGYLCPAECFDPDTLILMWNGNIKRAEEIKINDILINDKGNPSKIRTICSGKKNMYEIIPSNKNFIKHRVTDNHILTLKILDFKEITCDNKNKRPKKYSVKNLDKKELKIINKNFIDYEEALNFDINEINNYKEDILDISIEKYLELDEEIKKNLVLFKTDNINWKQKDILLDPYILGLWINTGFSNKIEIKLNPISEKEIIEFLEKWANTNNYIISKRKFYKFYILSINSFSDLSKNNIYNIFIKYNLLNNKYIPNDYLVNDRIIRLQLLAGLIDGESKISKIRNEISIYFSEKNILLFENVKFLIISLGFKFIINEKQNYKTNKNFGIKYNFIYKELILTGNNLNEIPTILKSKKINKFNKINSIKELNNVYSLFKLKETGKGKYVGWQLEDKVGRFLLSDGTVVHNTPEGQSVGVVKNISYLATITVNSNSTPIQEYIMNDIINFDDNKLYLNYNIYEFVKIFINGAWVGISKDPINLYNSLKEKKYKGIINIYTSIIFDYKNKEIRICNDAGRLIRPVLKIKNNKTLITEEIIKRLRCDDIQWDDLLCDCKLEESIIEYIDPVEQNSSMIAIHNKNLQSSSSNFIYNYTHCEIDASSIFGILASCIPFPDNNQSPRLTYQCAMGKQAMGVYVTNYDNRMDKTSYVHTYGMRPLVDTRIMNFINLHSIPSGAQVIVAIMTYTGYNQEDSILFNKGAIDRGLFQAVIYHTEKDEDKKIHGDQEIRCKPDPSKTKSMKFANYDKVNENGVIPENSIVEDRDIIISKVLPIKENRNDHTKLIKYEDQSKIYRTKEETYIDKNYIERNGEGYKFAKIRLRCLRKPVIGDKFSSRHGQKGTIGNIIPEENMPFTDEGIRPDLIINPHAIPSRMTIGQLKETLLGKVLLELGLFGDGTSFGNLSVSDICNELQKLGYESKGNEILYDGLNGEQLTSDIFIGPAFYQRLKHMVNDKQHSRSIGPMVNLTRQPAEGRSRDGGLRYGEMEKDAMVAHGASSFNKGRLYDASDAFKVYVCKQCGLIAAFNNEKHIHLCKTCENRTDFDEVKFPYSCKLLFQELTTMNIAPRIMT